MTSRDHRRLSITAGGPRSRRRNALGVEVLARIPVLTETRVDEAVADSPDVALGVGLVGFVVEGVEPESFGAEVGEALEMALAGAGGVLELLVAVVAVVFSQRHPRLSPVFR